MLHTLHEVSNDTQWKESLSSIPSLWVDVFFPIPVESWGQSLKGLNVAKFFPCECCENQAETYIDYYVFIDIQRSRIPFRKLPKTQEQQIHRQILYTNPTLQDWTELSNPTRIADAFVKFPDTTYAILKWLWFQELRIATYIPIWKTYWISKMSVLNIGHIKNLPHYMPRICVANCSCDG